jgi:hypothetical protein
MGEVNNNARIEREKNQSIYIFKNGQDVYKLIAG